MLIAVLIAGSIYAQDRNRERGNSRIVTVEGTLKLERGIVAIESGRTTYFVPLLTRYIGFINDLKEGTKVSVEGYSYRNVIHPVKLTIEGKPYDFPAIGRNHAFENRTPQPRLRESQPFDRRRENSRPERRRNAPPCRGCVCNFTGSNPA